MSSQSMRYVATPQLPTEIFEGRLGLQVGFEFNSERLDTLVQSTDFLTRQQLFRVEIVVVHDGGDVVQASGLQSGLGASEEIG